MLSINSLDLKWYLASVTLDVATIGLGHKNPIISQKINIQSFKFIFFIKFSRFAISCVTEAIIYQVLLKLIKMILDSQLLSKQTKIIIVKAHDNLNDSISLTYDKKIFNLQDCKNSWSVRMCSLQLFFTLLSYCSVIRSIDSTERINLFALIQRK